MNILVTGGSGFLGSALTEKLLEKGHRIYSISRHPPQMKENLVALNGDITLEDFGLPAELLPEQLDACYHLAAIHNLGEDKGGSIRKTNINGTVNVIQFCNKRHVPHLFFVSTAYTQGRNPYERSKMVCEMLTLHSGIPRVTILKPSVVMGTAEHPYTGHFAQFVRLLVKMHLRAETARRTVEGALSLPVLEPVFRVKGNAQGRLNLVTVDDVVAGMLEATSPGTYYLTNPEPPAIGDLVSWVGEYIKLNLKILPTFKATPIEWQFQRIAKSFSPYLYGDSFPSHLKSWTKIDRQFIHDTVARTLSY